MNESNGNEIEDRVKRVLEREKKVRKFISTWQPYLHEHLKRLEEFTEGKLGSFDLRIRKAMLNIIGLTSMKLMRDIHSFLKIKNRRALCLLLADLCSEIKELEFKWDLVWWSGWFKGVCDSLNVKWEDICGLHPNCGKFKCLDEKTDRFWSENMV